jgi:Flp pilus assembly protein CpaB
VTSPRNGRGELAALRELVTDSIHRNRRLAMALLAAAALVLTISAVRGTGPATAQVWVAAHDLPGGEPLQRDDLSLATFPRGAIPDGSLSAKTRPVGVMLAAPVRRGEPLTDVRVLSPFLLAAATSPHAVAVPVRITDGPAALALVRAGERVTVMAAGDPGLGGTARVRTVVTAVRVLAVPDHTTDAGSGLVIVAASPRQATRLAAIPVTDRISVAVRH